MSHFYTIADQQMGRLRMELAWVKKKRLFGKFCGNESGGMGKWPP
jgi:hypothetical protein